MSLVTVTVAVACNSLVDWYLLPRLLSAPHPRFLFRAWFWLDHKVSLYGWVPLALGLLGWDYLFRRHSKPKIKGWVVRKVLTLVLVAGIAPVIPWWVPAGQPPAGFLAKIHTYPGLPSTLAWAAVVLVAGLLCMNAETRDSLLGQGRILSLVSLGLLLIVLALTLVGWSVTYAHPIPLGR